MTSAKHSIHGSKISTKYCVIKTEHNPYLLNFNKSLKNGLN